MSFSRQGLAAAALLALSCSEPAPTTAPTGTGGAGGSGGAAAGGMGGTSGGASAAAGSSSAGMATVPGTFGAVAEIMRQNCGLPSCHGGGPEGQDLVYTNLSTLHNVLLTTVVSECMNSPLVKPGEPANSALLKLPNWECIDPSGGPFVMPQGCIDEPCLQPAELSSITAWIMAGATP